MVFVRIYEYLIEISAEKDGNYECILTFNSRWLINNGFYLIRLEGGFVNIAISYEESFDNFQIRS